MLYLIGFTGVGKTTIGKKLALINNINFIDTDKEIEKVTKNTISNIFYKNDEHYFRMIETKFLKNIKGKNIVSCGGGLPVFNNNMDYIKRCGTSIYLKASPSEIFDRLSDNLENRPLVKKKSKKELKKFIQKKIQEREKFYLMANYILNTNNLTENEVLRKINSLPFSI